MQISDPEIRHQHTYGMVLSRCHINCGHADQVNILLLFADGTLCKTFFVREQSKVWANKNGKLIANVLSGNGDSEDILGVLRHS